MTSYTFDDAFQQKLTAMLMRDEPFAQRVEGLVKAEFLTNAAHGWCATVVNEHFRKFQQLPTAPIVLNELRLARDGAKGKKLSEEDVEAIKTTLKYVYDKPDLSNREYMIEAVAKFARQRAIEDALIHAAEHMDRGGDPDDLRNVLSTALDTGATDDTGAIDFYADVDKRLDLRHALLTGTILTRSITTGFKELDDCLAGGWGRKGLWCLMGGPKAGKSTGLSQFAVNASLAGHNVLYLTCEVTGKETADRMDACIAVTKTRDLATSPAKIKSAIATARVKAGILKIHEYPNGVLKCSDIRRLIRRYQSQSIIFDLIVVDYADIMNSEASYDQERFKFAEIYGGLKNIAQTEDVAILTATQTNRAGAKAGTAKMTDVAEDLNKSRLVDGLISINANDDEKARGEFRLFFAAMRHVEDNYSLLCKSDRSTMRLISSVVGRE